MKIRIFALAKELGLDNKVLIDYCNAAGINVKNSALASISPEERDHVLNYIKTNVGSGGGKSAESRPLAPQREEAPDLAGKMRTIRTMAPRPHAGRMRAEAGDAAPPDDSGASVGVATEEPPAIEAPEERTETVETPSVAAELRPEEIQTPPATETDEQAAAPAAEAPAASDAPAADTARRAGPVPMRRDDYVSASGSFREMKPRGTVPASEIQNAQIKREQPKQQKPRTALPNLAAPSYKAPKAKTQRPDEGPAQKPDIPLTAEFLQQQSPLAAHIRRHDEQKKRGGPKKGEAPDLREIMRRAGKLTEQPPEDDRGVKKDIGGKRRISKRVGAEGEGDESGRRGRIVRRPRMKRHHGPVTLKTSAQIEHPITIRSLSEALGRPAKDMMRILFQRGEIVTINTTLPEETALDLALELGVDLEIKHPRTIEDDLLDALEADEASEKLATRPPIVTILGHVDHGKTTLVDKIRSANVAAGEAGGITQHIAAYQVEHNGHKITFVDTPGHAAFGEMRARGANVTDIVVLVVAADDGVMPQTVECISHAKSAGVPMVVAMNKIDLPTKNEQKVLQELAQQDVLPAEWGGDTEVVRTSGATGTGLDDLLETLLVTAELKELQANPERPAVGVCLEVFRDEGRGILAWFIVQKGTLRVGDVVLCGGAYGRIRAMYNDRDQEVQQAGPSTPIKVAGLDIVPAAGQHFFVMDDLEKAREAAEGRRHLGRTETLTRKGRPRSLEEILGAARGGAVQDLPLIIKADTPGSLEALRGEILKFEHPEVRVEIVHEGVGGVNESDVALASASGAIVIAFHVIAEDRAQAQAEREGVDVRRFEIIYEVTETIKRSLEGLLAPERVQVSTGRALVLQTFHISRFGTIAGCRVLNGTIERSSRIRLIRDQKVLNEFNLASLKRNKDDAKDVREGMECGIRLDGFNDIKEGDLLEAFKIEEIKRTLS